jgi:hypothetical protein
LRSKTSFLITIGGVVDNSCCRFLGYVPPSSSVKMPFLDCCRLRKSEAIPDSVVLLLRLLPLRIQHTARPNSERSDSWTVTSPGGCCACCCLSSLADSTHGGQRCSFLLVFFLVSSSTSFVRQQELLKNKFGLLLKSIARSMADIVVAG